MFRLFPIFLCISMCIAFKLFDVDATTRFHFNGTIICRTPLEGSFVQMLAVYEDDLT